MQDKLPPTIEVDEGIEFKKNLKELRKKYRSIKEDIKPLVQKLKSGEIPGDKISGSKYSVFKTRIKNSDNRKGQSGGYRVIYYTKTAEAILLTTIHSKSDRENISNREIEDIIEQEEIEFERQAKELVTAEPEDFESRE